MTDTTMIEAPAKAPRRRRKKARRAPRVAGPVAKAAAIPDELAGITNTECPLECGPKGCVISGKPYCGHPRKGGLQGAETADPAAIDRAHRAKTALAHMALDNRKD
jgi:hypothetical protein